MVLDMEVDKEEKHKNTKIQNYKCVAEICGWHGSGYGVWHGGRHGGQQDGHHGHHGQADMVLDMEVGVVADGLEVKPLHF